MVGAFTATATSQVREDVERIMKLQDPLRTVTGFDRPNLFFEVIHPERKDPELLRLLSARKGKSGIVYCSTRKKVETVCELLRDNGYAATRYHAGLEEEERAANSFMASESDRSVRRRFSCDDFSSDCICSKRA